MLSKDFKWFVAVTVSACLGLLVGVMLAAHMGIQKAEASGEVLTASQLQIVDSSGQRRILMVTSAEGTPALWFFYKDGKARLNLGLYDDGNALVVLNDRNEQAAEIVRTVGSQSAPVLVQKNNGQDRLVQGLNFNGDMEPFLVRYDKSGSKKAEFGSY